MAQLSVFLSFPGNAEKAFNFYKSVFHGEFSTLLRFKDMPRAGGKVTKQEENRILNIILPFGKDNVLMASDTLDSRKQKIIQGNNMYVSISPDNKKEADRIFDALSEGGHIIIPMSDQPWHAYYGSLMDQFGVGWMVNYSYQQAEKKNKPAVKGTKEPQGHRKASATTKRKINARPAVKTRAKTVRKVKAKLKLIPKKKAKAAPAIMNRRKTVKAASPVKAKVITGAAAKRKSKTIPPPKRRMTRELAGARGGK